MMPEKQTDWKESNRENVIYGAGVFGQKLLGFLKDLNVPVHFFCQTETTGAPKECEGIPILSLAELKKHSVDKNIFLALANSETSRQLRQTLQGMFFETARIYECGDFIRENLRHAEGDHYCLLCGNYFDNFEAGGSDFAIFREHHIIGGGLRRNFHCPCCGAVDRERWIYKVLSEKTGIFSESCRVLHFAPEPHIREVIKQNKKCDYYDVDIEIGRARHRIDMTDIPFQDNTFDYIIANHVLEHIREEEKALQELKRVLKKSGKLILSFPICKDKKTEEDLGELSEEERIARFGQNDHVRLYGTDYVERLEGRGFCVYCYSPEDDLEEEQIERYGLIQGDVCIACGKNNK